MSADFLHLIPYGHDPLSTLAELILDRHAATLPDLSAHAVLLSHRGAAPRLRQLLLDAAARRGYAAMLPPYVGTLDVWLRAFATHDGLTAAGREVVLLEALGEHPQLQQTTPWPFVDSALALFTQLSTYGVPVPQNIAEFTGALARGYGIGDTHWRPLGHEAQLAYNLWQAWREELHERGHQDEATTRRQCLQRSIAQLAPDTRLYVAGFAAFSADEIEWLKALQRRRQLTLICHGQVGNDGYHPDTPLTDLTRSLVGAAPKEAQIPKSALSLLLDEVYRLDGDDLQARASHARTRATQSPLAGRLAVFSAADAEEEARAVDLQVRRWWLQGHRHIGVVTNDRKLARRVRALLERAQVALQDAAGWPLSTTSAATALIRWLDAIEQGFAYAPLSDLFTSPFAFPAFPATERRMACARFESQVLGPQNLVGGLKRLRDALSKYRQALDPDCVNVLNEMLRNLEEVAQGLTRLCDGKAHAAGAYLEALTLSMETLGMTACYAEDEAGRHIVIEIEAMQAAAGRRPLILTWTEFRAWLRHNLERHYFQPPIYGRGIEFMSFAESRLRRFDALILAGAHQDCLPGPVEHSGFFNDAVRRELGLPTTVDQRRVLLYDFRRLLEAADQVLITVRREEAGERAVPSPWVERLRAFHQLSYGDDLEAPALKELLAFPETLLADRSAPAAEPRDQPAVQVPPDLLPTRISASAHQRLLDCPYQYYAMHCLGLRVRAGLRAGLEKIDYGERIHRILQAFHGGLSGLPGPFTEALTTAGLPQAEALLAVISHAVFAADIKRDFLARGYLHRWLRLIPSYLTWQLQRSAEWSPAAAELASQEQRLPQSDLILTGRIDRVDHGAHGYSIIDYKTGMLPRATDVAAGEHIQLPFYALLLADSGHPDSLPLAPLHEALFLGLGQEGLKPGPKLAGVDLRELSQGVAARLVYAQDTMRSGRPLPAWGDPATCSRCDMEGLCRKEMWYNALLPPAA